MPTQLEPVLHPCWQFGQGTSRSGGIEQFSLGVRLNHFIGEQFGDISGGSAQGRSPVVSLSRLPPLLLPTLVGLLAGFIPGFESETGLALRCDRQGAV